MGLSTTTRDSMSTRRTVFETSSKSASEGTIGPMHEDDSLLRLDGEQICYGPWDDWNLFERLTNSDIDREYAMEEYVNYLSSLFKKLPGVYTPPSYPTGLPLSTYEDAYETDGRASPCPSLTDNSTLSRSSSFESPARYFSTRRESLLPLKSKLPRTLGKNKRYEGLKDLETTPIQPPYPKLGCSLNLKSKFERWPSSYKSSRPIVTATSAPSKLRTNIHTQFDEMGDSGSPDSETSTDISSSSSSEDDDDEYDPFENLNNAIRQVFSFNKQLADKVIDYLVRLPPDRRAKVYGYGHITSHGADDLQESSIVASYGGNSRPTKRKRIGEISPGNLRQDQTFGGDDYDNQVLVDRQLPEKASTHRRFACGYNLFDRATYSPRSTRGRTATRYKSCAGPGFSSLNHYKRHLERVHTLHQCPRCGDIFDASGELQTHLAQESRCNLLTFERERSMSQATWDLVKGIFKKKRKAEDEPSDEERWFRVWDALFPEAQRPPTAYYEESHMHSAYQARALEVFDCLLTNEPQLAPVRSHRDYIIAALRRALDVAGQGTQLDQEVDDQFMISPPPPHAPLPSRNAQDRTLDTNQINLSETGIPDATNPYAGLSSHLEQPRYPDSELIDDVALYGLSDPTYTDMNFITNEYDDTLYLDPREFGSL